VAKKLTVTKEELEKLYVEHTIQRMQKFYAPSVTIRSISRKSGELMGTPNTER